MRELPAATSGRLFLVLVTDCVAATCPWLHDLGILFTALSRSRDRLCGSHLSLVARSRDTLYSSSTNAARRRSRDELSTLLSRSHEALALQDCLQKIGVRPLAGFYGSMIDTNISQGLEPDNGFIMSNITSTTTDVSLSNGDTSPQSNSTDDSARGDAMEDSDSEGTLREEDGSATTSPDNAPAKICDSDGESDREKVSGTGKIQEKDQNLDLKDMIEREESNNEVVKKETEVENENMRGITCASVMASTNSPVFGVIEGNQGDEPQPPEPEEPRYTVAQLISVFNKRWESSQKLGIGRPPPITLPSMTEDAPGREEQAGETIMKEEGTSRDNENSGDEIKLRTEGDDGSKLSSVQYLRSGSLSSETSGYETPSDASSMASWEEGMAKQVKSVLTEKESEVGIRSQTSEKKCTSQGPPLFHHTWGMKVCDGSYNRAMSRFGNADRNREHKGRACKSLGEQTADRSHRKCKPLVKPFL